jgi:hypothetical protein
VRFSFENHDKKLRTTAGSQMIRVLMTVP